VSRRNPGHPRSRHVEASGDLVVPGMAIGADSRTRRGLALKGAQPVVVRPPGGVFLLRTGSLDDGASSSSSCFGAAHLLRPRRAYSFEAIDLTNVLPGRRTGVVQLLAHDESAATSFSRVIFGIRTSMEVGVFVAFVSSDHRRHRGCRLRLLRWLDRQHPSNAHHQTRHSCCTASRLSPIFDGRCACSAREVPLARVAVIRAAHHPSGTGARAASCAACSGACLS